MKIKLFYLVTALLLLLQSLEGVYILRYSTLNNGGLSYTGNTLGLSKRAGQNNPGTSDSIGAFITTEQPLPAPVGSYPNDGTAAGTTLNYLENSSSAVLDLPSGSTVLYAELIWMGSFDFYSQITGNEPNGPVTITTPQLSTFSVLADPATAQNATTPGYGCPGPSPTPCNCPCGNYVRSQNVTSIVQGGGAGTYTVGGVAGTSAAGDDTHNAAGWVLAVAYQNPLMYTSNLTIFVGCEQASSNTNSPASAKGFCAPPSGFISARLFTSAIEGDANKTGDTMLFSTAQPFTPADRLSGTNNPINNFFASQINTLLPLTTDPITGKLVALGSSQLDTRGSYGTTNQDAVAGTNVSGGRQGIDITSIDITSSINFNDTSAYAQGTTTGDDYTISSVGIQIQVGAPILIASKLVDGVLDVDRNIGDTVTFSISLENSGTADAYSVIFKDPLESGLSFVPGTFTINGIPQPNPNFTTGVSLGTIAVGDSVTLAFQALITGYPPTGIIFYNSSYIDYNFQPCLGNLVPLEAGTNQVSITLPDFPPPECFTGCLIRCCSRIKLSWCPPLQPESVVAYRIYYGNVLIAELPPEPLYTYVLRYKQGVNLQNLSITAVYPGGNESAPVPITF